MDLKLKQYFKAIDACPVVVDKRALSADIRRGGRENFPDFKISASFLSPLS